MPLAQRGAQTMGTVVGQHMLRRVSDATEPSALRVWDSPSLQAPGSCLLESLCPLQDLHGA